jgi:hypothetical protein
MFVPNEIVKVVTRYIMECWENKNGIGLDPVGTRQVKTSLGQ